MEYLYACASQDISDKAQAHSFTKKSLQAAQLRHGYASTNEAPPVLQGVLLLTVYGEALINAAFFGNAHMVTGPTAALVTSFLIPMTNVAACATAGFFIGRYRDYGKNALDSDDEYFRRKRNKARVEFIGFRANSFCWIGLSWSERSFWNLYEYRFLKVLKGFAMDKTAKELAEETGISEKSIRSTYRGFRNKLIEAAIYNRDAFGGAGFYLLRKGKLDEQGKRFLQGVAESKIFIDHLDRHEPRLHSADDLQGLIFEVVIRVFCNVDMDEGDRFHFSPTVEFHPMEAKAGFKFLIFDVDLVEEGMESVSVFTFQKAETEPGYKVNLGDEGCILEERVLIPSDECDYDLESYPAGGIAGDNNNPWKTLDFDPTI